MIFLRVFVAWVSVAGVLVFLVHRDHLRQQQQRQSRVSHGLIITRRAIQSHSQQRDMELTPIHTLVIRRSQRKQQLLAMPHSMVQRKFLLHNFQQALQQQLSHSEMLQLGSLQHMRQPLIHILAIKRSLNEVLPRGMHRSTVVSLFRWRICRPLRRQQKVLLNWRRQPKSQQDLLYKQVTHDSLMPEHR